VYVEPETYDHVAFDDRISIVGLADLEPDSKVRCLLHHIDGSTEEFWCTHSLSEEHIDWFHAGSALNLIGARFRAAQAAEE
jgi:aconitate hydratase